VGRQAMAVLAGIVAIAMISGGCGSEGDSATTASLTKAEFIEKADAICSKTGERYKAKVAVFAKKHGLNDYEQPTKAQREEVMTAVILPALSAEAEDLDRLGAPEGDEEEVEAIVEGIEGAVERAEDEPGSVFEKGSGSFKKVNKLARAYGLEICG
jgi:hypothetical protein